MNEQANYFLVGLAATSRSAEAARQLPRREGTVCRPEAPTGLASGDPAKPGQQKPEAQDGGNEPQHSGDHPTRGRSWLGGKTGKGGHRSVEVRRRSLRGPGLKPYRGGRVPTPPNTTRLVARKP